MKLYTFQNFMEVQDTSVIRGRQNELKSPFKDQLNAVV